MNRLVSYGLLSDPAAMVDWKNGIADLGVNELAIGINKAKDFKGYLTLGDFRGMCKIPTGHASFRRYKALPTKPLEGTEIRSRIAKMKGELKL